MTEKSAAVVVRKRGCPGVDLRGICFASWTDKGKALHRPGLREGAPGDPDGLVEGLS